MCSPSSVRLHPIPRCLFLHPLTPHLPRWHAASGRKRKETSMQSTNIRQIKAAIRDQEFTGLDSGHTVISHAVFCLKKKQQNSTMYSSTLVRTSADDMA